MKKILLTWANGMLWNDFIKYFGDKFTILPLDKSNWDITNEELIENFIQKNTPDIIINFAAYTNVENAEDIGKKDNFDVNTLWVYNLAKISAKNNIDLITISTDYVFDGTKKEWYKENDTRNPINSYWMAKYLGEILSKQENPQSIIIRTSRLYGWGKEFNNFVNTMIRIWNEKNEVKVVNDQFGSPTYTIDLCKAIVKITENIETYRGEILHLSNQTENNGISRFEFAKEIFKVAGVKAKLIPCSSEEFITKAKRPTNSKLLDSNNFNLGNRKIAIIEYYNRLQLV